MMYSDPSGLVGILSTFAASLVALLVTFGVELTPDQQVKILAAVTAGAPLIVAWLIRFRAYSPATHERELAVARREGGLPEQTDNREVAADGPQPGQESRPYEPGLS